MFRHELAVVTADERLVFFGVRRPAAGVEQ
jgi:hypothetical protein